MDKQYVELSKVLTKKYPMVRDYLLLTESFTGKSVEKDSFKYYCLIFREINDLINAPDEGIISEKIKKIETRLDKLTALYSQTLVSGILDRYGRPFSPFRDNILKSKLIPLAEDGKEAFSSFDWIKARNKHEKGIISFFKEMDISIELPSEKKPIYYKLDDTLIKNVNMLFNTHYPCIEEVLYWIYMIFPKGISLKISLELRDSLDHITKAFEGRDPEKQLYYAEEHMRRGAVESLQRCCREQWKYIHNLGEKIWDFSSKDRAILLEDNPEFAMNLFLVKKELYEARRLKATEGWQYALEKYGQAIERLIKAHQYVQSLIDKNNKG